MKLFIGLLLAVATTAAIIACRNASSPLLDIDVNNAPLTEVMDLLHQKTLLLRNTTDFDIHRHMRPVTLRLHQVRLEEIIRHLSEQEPELLLTLSTPANVPFPLLVINVK